MHARRVVALLALDRHVELVRVRHGVIVVGVAVFEIHRAFLHFQHADVAVAGRAVVVVLMMAGLGAAPAADADAEIERVAEFHAFLRAVVTDGDLRAIVFPGILLKVLKHCGELLLVELTIVLLEKLID